ncbi:hypothetical protein F7725_010678 [Dissostichus mawsoni]|uniref:Uncharacterized protein n=1 Tax=Dissostichus mawsoni TaxID=36200 RepID=A0A7J5XPF4_DISMA|nr:hypothetical protein F7725_010678 [Dissostichus mawsoni]
MMSVTAPGQEAHQPPDEVAAAVAEGGLCEGDFAEAVSSRIRDLVLVSGNRGLLSPLLPRPEGSMSGCQCPQGSPPDVGHFGSEPDVGHFGSGPDVGHFGSGPDVGHFGSGPDVGHFGSGPDVGHFGSGPDVDTLALGLIYTNAPVHLEGKHKMHVELQQGVSPLETSSSGKSRLLIINHMKVFSAFH